MEDDRNGDSEGFVHRLDHRGDDFEAAHVFARAFADAEDDRALLSFRFEENGFGPFEVVDVELSDGIMIVVGDTQHPSRIN